ITGGTGATLFEIDASSGAVTVKTGAVLRSEERRGEGLRGKGSDGGTPANFTTQSVTVSLNDLNDNTPIISSSASMAVDENATAGTAVGTVVDTDADATAPYNTVSYAITGGTGATLFEIDATSGAVTVKTGAVL